MRVIYLSSVFRFPPYAFTPIFSSVTLVFIYATPTIWHAVIFACPSPLSTSLPFHAGT